jgi:hypothetical protein
MGRGGNVIMEIWEFNAIVEEIRDKSFTLDYTLGYDNVECIKIEDIIDILDNMTEWGGY